MNNSDIKLHTLNEAIEIFKALNHKIDTLEVLNKDFTNLGYSDLSDQISKMFKHLNKLDSVLKQSQYIVMPSTTPVPVAITPDGGVIPAFDDKKEEVFNNFYKKIN